MAIVFPHAFSTPEYEGVWFPFNGLRMAARAWIQSYLREQLNDDAGELVVGEDGPHWAGAVPLKGISYAHTDPKKGGIAILVFSKTHELGVDVELLNRELTQSWQDLAKRFFSGPEAAVLKTREEFVRLWVKKEAYAKLTRKGISGTMSALLPTSITFQEIPVKVAGTECIVAYSTVSAATSSIVHAAHS